MSEGLYQISIEFDHDLILDDKGREQLEQFHKHMRGGLLGAIRTPQFVFGEDIPEMEPQNYVHYSIKGERKAEILKERIMEGCLASGVEIYKRNQEAGDNQHV